MGLLKLFTVAKSLRNTPLFVHSGKSPVHLDLYAKRRPLAVLSGFKGATKWAKITGGTTGQSKSLTRPSTQLCHVARY